MLNRRVEEWRGGSSLWLVLFRLVGPPLQPVEVGLFPGMGCMVPQPYAAGGNRSYPGVLGRNRRPVAPGVNYPNNSPRALRWAGGRSRSLDSGQNRFSYGTIGTSIGFGGEIMGLKPPWDQLRIPGWCLPCFKEFSALMIGVVPCWPRSSVGDVGYRGARRGWCSVGHHQYWCGRCRRFRGCNPGWRSSARPSRLCVPAHQLEAGIECGRVRVFIGCHRGAVAPRGIGLGPSHHSSLGLS
jgi:hypothetical protein